MAGVGWFESQAPNQHGLYAQNPLAPELVGRGLGCQPRASTPAHSHTLSPYSAAISDQAASRSLWDSLQSGFSKVKTKKF